jgi:hypothetical protein
MKIKLTLLIIILLAIKVRVKTQVIPDPNIADKICKTEESKTEWKAIKIPANCVMGDKLLKDSENE